MAERNQVAPNDRGGEFERTYWRAAPRLDSNTGPLPTDNIPDAEFRLLADNIPTLCWMANGDGYIVWYNRRWHEYCGTSPAEMEGWGWQSVHDPDLLPEVMERWTSCVATGEPFEMTFPLRGADGVFRPFLTRIQPVRDARGEVARWFGVNSEIASQGAAEEALRESEARFRNMADHAPMMMWVTDPEARCTYLNKCWYDFTGQDSGAGEGSGWLEAVHPDDRGWSGDVFVAANAKRESFRLEYRLRRHDGTYRWTMDAASPRFSPKGEFLGYIGSVIDIDERREAEDAVRESEERLRAALTQQSTILSQLDEGVIVADAQGRITFVNDAAARIHGVARLDVAPDDYNESYHLFTEEGEPYPPEQLPLARTVATGEPVFDARWRIRTPDGRDVLARGSSKPVIAEDGTRLGSVLTLRDETARAAAEEALRESEARFRAVADSAPAPVWVTSAEGMVFANKAFGEIAGRPAEEITGEVWMEMIHPADLEEAMRRRAEAWEKRADYGFEARFRRFDGAEISMQVSCRPRFDPSGELLGFVGIAFDITELRRAETALRESEEKLRIALSASTLGDWEWDVASDVISFSEQAASLFGLPAGPVGKWGDLQKLIDPSDSPGAMETVADAVAGHRDYNIEFRLKQPDGGQAWINALGRPVYDAAGNPTGVIGVVQDITARKRVEQRLRADKSSLETLNRIGAGLAGELEVERVVQMVTDAGRELCGARIGAFFYNVVDEAGDAYMLYALSGAKRSDFDKFPMPRKTAIFGPTFDGEGPVRSDDITKDPRYGLSDTHFGMPKDHLPVVSYLAVPVISRSGEVIGGLFYGHEETGRFTERHEQQLLGIAGQAAVAIDNARLFEAAQRELAERKRAEEALRALNQSLEDRIAAAIAEREQAEEALRQSQKMEAVGQLTGGIAHDFNNLLTIITGNIETARRHVGEEGSPRVQRSLGNALVGAERAATLTQRLLAFSRRQPLNPRSIDPNKLVTGMGDLMHRTLGETIAVETVLAGGLWRVEADPNQLENAILNLAVNARDAMPDGGKLTIETANMHLDRDYAERNTGMIPGQYVAICVSDTGTGMDDDTLARAFEPFFTTKEVGKGTGLGLSQVYGFVKQSGGHLKIYSEAGQGTTVRIYLPRLLAEEAVEEMQVEAPLPEGGNEETILVCEDDDDVRAYTVEALRELGYRVLEAHDGPSALRLLERQDGKVDLLFTDVVLPSGMTGAEVAEEVRKLRPEIKILFTTGYARNAIVHHGRLDPGVELITKPFAYADLAARIRDMLDRP